MVVDLRLGSDLDLIVDSDSGDLQTVDGVANIEQSVALLVGSELQSLVGEPVTSQTVAQVESAVTSALARDPQVTGVEGTSILEIDRRTNTVSIEVQTRQSDFVINPTAGE
jgi:outer membrane translocation and assembly module TamA